MSHEEAEYVARLEALEAGVSRLCADILNLGPAAHAYDPLGKREHSKALETLTKCHDRLRVICAAFPGIRQMFGGL